MNKCVVILKAKRGTMDKTADAIRRLSQALEVQTNSTIYNAILSTNPKLTVSAIVRLHLSLCPVVTVTDFDVCEN